MSGLLYSDYADTSAALGGPSAPPSIGAPVPIAPSRPRVPQEKPVSLAPSKTAPTTEPSVATQSSENNLTLARRQREQGENPAHDPNAQNPYSSAGGNNQIIDGTWLQLMNTYHPEMVQGKTREQVLAMKTDGPLNDEMAAKYDQENAKILASNGVAPTPNFINALYRAGPQGGMAIIRAAQQNPSALVKDVAPDMATPGNNGAGNMTVGQFLMNPYARGPGSQSGDTPQQMYTLAQGNQILQQLMEDSKQGKARVAEIDKNYKPVEVPPMPKPPETDPLHTFSTLAGVFATLAAGFSRTPAIAAMNGLAGAMDAAKKNDWEQYKAHYDQFKTQSDLALKAHEQHSADVRDALEMMTKNMAAGTATLNATVALSNDEEMHKLHEQQRYVEMAHLQDERDEKARKWAMEQPLYEASAQLTAAMHNRDDALRSNNPEAIKAADALVTQAENRVAEVKRALMGGGKAQTPQAIAIQRYIEGHPEATAEDIQKFIVGFKEDAPGVAARKDRAEQLKETHETNWRTINEDKTKTTREIADARLAEAATWHATQADLTVKKLDQNASIAERKENELERHNARRELIDSDWHLTVAEKDRLKRNEDIRWHDLQNERGWGGIESRERTANRGIDERKRHDERSEEITNNRNISYNERADLLAQEKIRHFKAMEEGTPTTPAEKEASAAQAATGMPLTQISPGYGPAAVNERKRLHQDAIDRIMKETGASAADAGVELANRTIEFQSGKRSSGQLTTMLGATIQAVGQLDFNIDKTKQEMAKLTSSDLSPLLNALARGEEKWTGDPAYASLYYYMHATAMESARILSGGQASIAQLNQGAADEAAKWASINMTPASFNAVAQAMKDEGAARIKTYEAALNAQRVPPGQRNTQMPSAAPGGGAQTLPPEALKSLQPNHETTFGNGQVWTLGSDGQPKRVR